VALLAFDDLAVAWSPDGAWLAASGFLGLVLVQVEGGSVHQLSPTSSFGSIDWR
jgi:hypothetical protein